MRSHSRSVNLGGAHLFQNNGAVHHSTAAGHNIVNQQNGFAFDFAAVSAGRKGSGQIVFSFGKRKLVLNLGFLMSFQHIGQIFYSQKSRRCLCQKFSLIIASFRQSIGMQRPGTYPKAWRKLFCPDISEPKYTAWDNRHKAKRNKKRQCNFSVHWHRRNKASVRQRQI